MGRAALHREGSPWPGKVPGHNRMSFEYEFDPKGFYRYTFKPAARALGMPELKLHELRHTFATIALESGALSMHELSRSMGHASYAVTDKVYSHLSRRSYAKARANFSAAMSAGQDAPIRMIR